MNQRSGMTFLEVLLAILLLTFILGTASHVLYGLVHFWDQIEEEPVLVQHAEGVTGFLSYLFDQSVDLARDQADRHYGWQAPPRGSQPTFHVRLRKGHPFFVTEVRPQPRVDAWLGFEPDEGLFFLWHIPPRHTSRRVVMQRTMLSPWVRDVELGELDIERNAWIYTSLREEADEVRREPPGALRILFEKDGQEVMQTVRLRKHARNVLVY